MAPAICRYWQTSTCKFGTNCRFPHPDEYQSSNNNRFGVLGGLSGRGSHSSPYNLTKDSIARDLTEDAPQWILSAYGPGKDAPEQLFGGYPREMSFEEIRLYYVEGTMSGNVQIAVNDIDSQLSNARAQIQQALSNPEAAVQYIVQAGNKHPNRLDVCKEGSQSDRGVFKQAAVNAFGNPSPNSFGGPSTTSQGNRFSAPTQPTTSGFGQVSTLGARLSPFGAPSFAQTAQPAAAGGFGQASVLGQKPTPFSAPTANQNPFEQPQQQQCANSFGMQPRAGANPFGASVQPNPSLFAQVKAQPTPYPFGGEHPQQQTNAGPFGGQPAAPVASAEAPPGLLGVAATAAAPVSTL